MKRQSILILAMYSWAISLTVLGQGNIDSQKLPDGQFRRDQNKAPNPDGQFRLDQKPAPNTTNGVRDAYPRPDGGAHTLPLEGRSDGGQNLGAKPGDLGGRGATSRERYVATSCNNLEPIHNMLGFAGTKPLEKFEAEVTLCLREYAGDNSEQNAQLNKLTDCMSRASAELSTQLGKVAVCNKFQKCE